MLWTDLHIAPIRGGWMAAYISVTQANTPELAARKRSQNEDSGTAVVRPDNRD
jgi:hypothetical protein